MIGDVSTMDVIKADNVVETFFVRRLNQLFRAWGKAIARNPWLFIGVSLLLTIFCSVRIPFTPITNDVVDFTPYGARARSEIQAYQSFFSKEGDPVVLFLLVTAKNNDKNMFGVNELDEAVQLLNMVNEHFKVFDTLSKREISFNQFCDNFCTINEPVRHFHSGLQLERSFGNSSLEHINLGYPITTVLGRQLHMDPHFFGVKVTVKSANGTIKEVSVNEMRDENGQQPPMFDSPSSQLPNNIRAISVVGLHFRAIRPAGVSKESIQDWQRKIAYFVRNDFKREFVDALVLSETLLTDEVVKAGLTLLPFLLIGFAIMVIFSSVTMSVAAFYMGQMGQDKILLAIVACCCPFMACGTALGGMFWAGFRFGSLLCVTPFLVLALGVDDAYLMLNSWQRLRQKMERDGKRCKVEDQAKTEEENAHGLIQKLMADVMVDTGASITITTLTNVLAFAIGAATPTPEIRLFSIGNAIAITVVYIYQWTVFGSTMALFGSYEFQKLNYVASDTPPIQPDTASGNSEVDSGLEIRGSLNSVSRTCSSKNGEENRMGGIFRQFVQKICTRFLHFYCQLLANCWVALGVMSLLAVYIYASIYGLLTIRAELKPEQLFLQSSDVQHILQLRNQYIMPFYAVCLVFVNHPGNFSDPIQRQKWHSLVADFEALPSSVGHFSTKFWLRDYEQFVEADSADEAAPIDDLASFEGIPFTERHNNELAEFLQWPEFQFWNGFIQLEKNDTNISNKNDSSATDQLGPKLSRFFFSTAAFGAELKEWSKREQLLSHWRRVADSYPELDVSIYEDEAKFLDLIPTMIPQTFQSAVCTLICMFLVCLLFMTNPGSLLVSIFAIFSTCIGVFGLQSLMGAALDPIFMSAAIMSIGFSVDIPAHIAYHFYKTGANVAIERDMVGRLRECLSAIAFPVLEAGLSTLICVSSLFFVNLHMARVFASTMTLVVAIGLLHGLLIIPVMLCQISTFLPFSNQQGNKYPSTRRITDKQNRNSKIHVAVLPTVLTVNHQETVENRAGIL